MARRAKHANRVELPRGTHSRQVVFDAEPICRNQRGSFDTQHRTKSRGHVSWSEVLADIEQLGVNCKQCFCKAHVRWYGTVTVWGTCSFCCCLRFVDQCDTWAMHPEHLLNWALRPHAGTLIPTERVRASGGIAHHPSGACNTVKKHSPSSSQCKSNATPHSHLRNTRQSNASEASLHQEHGGAVSVT